MMSSRGAPPDPSSDPLLQRPWLPVAVSGCRLLAKTWFGETSYRVLLTDLHSVWEETMDSAAIQRRAQELNKRLRAPVQAFFSYLCEVAEPCLSGGGGRGGEEGDARMSLTRQEDGDINMRLKSELSGLPFYWEFHCTPAPVTVVCLQLVRPLLAMSRLLQHQVETLGGLLLRKDAEIQDYRENGATLSRERLQTDAFNEETYTQDFMEKALPQVCSEQQDSLGFSSDLQHLYSAIVSHGNTRKRKLSEERHVEREQEQLASEDSDLTPSLGEAAASGEAGETVVEQSRDDAPADTCTTQQSFSISSAPAARPPSKPKKKKVGLFR